MDHVDWDARPETYWDGRGLFQGDAGFQRAQPAIPAGLVGEHLPKLEGGEVEIALITMRSTMGDVISIRARQDGEVIRYIVVDEYEDERQGEPGYEFEPEQSSEPLTFRELTDLIWSFNQSEFGNLFEAHWSQDLDVNSFDDEPNDFFFLSSEFYSGLQDWLEGKFLEMKLSKRDECDDHESE